MMKSFASLAATTVLLLGASAVSAQTAAEPPAGAGAAAAVSGNAASAEPQAGADAPGAAGTTGETGAADQPASDGAQGAAALRQPVEPAPVDMEPEYEENGRWYTAEDIPTFKLTDGKLDFASFSGYRRYHAECHVCHGPDGEGSSYAPALKDSVMRMDYYEFMQVVASGKQTVNAASNQVMPAFGTNRNVWCYVEDIYAYLRAHGSGAIPRGRPAEREDKSDAFSAQEISCMEG